MAAPEEKGSGARSFCVSLVLSIPSRCFPSLFIGRAPRARSALLDHRYDYHEIFLTPLHGARCRPWRTDGHEATRRPISLARQFGCAEPSLHFPLTIAFVVVHAVLKKFESMTPKEEAPAPGPRSQRPSSGATRASSTKKAESGAVNTPPASTATQSTPASSKTPEAAPVDTPTPAKTPVDAPVAPAPAKTPEAAPTPTVGHAPSAAKEESTPVAVAPKSDEKPKPDEAENPPHPSRPVPTRPTASSFSEAKPTERKDENPNRPLLGVARRDSRPVLDLKKAEESKKEADANKKETTEARKDTPKKDAEPKEPLKPLDLPLKDAEEKKDKSKGKEKETKPDKKDEKVEKAAPAKDDIVEEPIAPPVAGDEKVPKRSTKDSIEREKSSDSSEKEKDKDKDVETEKVKDKEEESNDTVSPQSKKKHNRDKSLIGKLGGSFSSGLSQVKTQVFDVFTMTLYDL